MKKIIKDKGKKEGKKIVAKGVEKAACLVDRVPSVNPVVAVGKKAA